MPASTSRRVGMSAPASGGQRRRAHDATANLAVTFEDMSRLLTDANVMHAGDHARRDDGAGAQWTAAARRLAQREGESAESALANRRPALPDHRAVDIRGYGNLRDVAPAANALPDHD